MRTLTPAGKTIQDYPVLLRRVRQTIAKGRERAQDAVERERVRTAWETGRLIQEHILLNQTRAGYGQKVIFRLSGDLGISDRELRYMTEFARTYPIWRTSAKLTWGHIQSLLAVNDEKKREDLMHRAVKEKWTLDETRREIRKVNGVKQRGLVFAGFPGVPLGTLHTYCAAAPKGRLKLDLGFNLYLDLPERALKKMKEGDIVQVKKNSQYTVRGTPADLYTYEASITEVVDGDTFHCLIDLGFGIALEQRLRLRRLNAPEIITRDGQKAKRVLEKALGMTRSEKTSPSSRAVISTPVLIKTSKTDDQYGRYLADIWVMNKSIEQELLDSGIFTIRGRDESFEGGQ